MSLYSTLLFIVLQAAATFASRTHIKNIVTFGDSYTDITVASFALWPIYAANYGNLSMFDFARSGATCSNSLTPRIFPGVLGDEIPAYENATAHGNLLLDPSETLYTLWIGTNDLGVGQLITGQSVSGVSIVNTSACAVSWVKKLYDTGARNFYLQNVESLSNLRSCVNLTHHQIVPLDRLPLYSANSYSNKYWTAQRNTTEWNVFMKELVAAGNSISELMLANLAKTLPGSHICKLV